MDPKSCDEIRPLNPAGGAIQVKVFLEAGGRFPKARHLGF